MPDQALAPMLILHGEIFVFVIVDSLVVLVLLNEKERRIPDKEANIHMSQVCIRHPSGRR